MGLFYILQDGRSVSEHEGSQMLGQDVASEDKPDVEAEGQDKGLRTGFLELVDTRLRT